MTARYGDAPNPATVTPYPGAPRFFVRRYDLSQSTIGGVSLRRGGFVVDETPLYPEGGELLIYGFAMRSTFPEDARIERQAWERRRAFMAWCFSHMAPTGELGFVVADDDVEEISRDTFEEAIDRLRGADS